MKRLRQKSKPPQSNFENTQKKKTKTSKEEGNNVLVKLRGGKTHISMECMDYHLVYSILP